MKVKDAMYDGRHYGLTLKETVKYYNIEAGAQGLDHYAYERGNYAYLIRGFGGGSVVSKWELMDLYNELRHARLGKVEA